MKRIAAIVALGALAFGLAGCAANDGDSVTLNLWVFEPEKSFFNTVISEFEADHPGVTIKVSQVPEDQYSTKIQTSFAAGGGPDIGFVYKPSWVQSGKVLPLDDAIADAGIDTSNYAGSVLDVCRKDGKLYCLGTVSGAVLLFYNKAMFDDAKLAYPSATEPMTVDQYAELAAKLTKGTPSDLENVVFGAAVSPPMSWMSSSLNVTSDGRSVDPVLSKRTEHAYQTLADIAIDGHAPTSSILQSLGGSDDAALLDLLAQGKVAMYTTDNTAAVPELETQKIAYGVAPVPVSEAGDPQYIAGWTDTWGAFAGTKHPVEAAEFVAFMGSRGNEVRLSQGQLPLDIALASASDWASKGDADGREELLQVMSVANTDSVFTPDFFDWADPLIGAFGSIDKNRDAGDVLAGIKGDLQKNLDDAWQAYGSAG